MKRIGTRLICVLLFAAMCISIAPVASLAQEGAVVKNYFIKADFNTMTGAFNNSLRTGVSAYFDILKSGDYMNSSDPAVAERVTSNRVTGASGIDGDYAPVLTLSKKLATSDKYDMNEGTYLSMTPLEGALSASKLVLEMDTNISQTGQITFQNLFDTYSINIFGNDGKIYGSSTAYQTGEWKQLRIEFDYTLDKADIYYDNTYCTTINGVSEADFRDSSRAITIRMTKTTDTGLKFGVDNIALFENVQSEKIVGVGYTFDGTVKNGNIISSSAQDIVLTMADGFSESNTSATVKLQKDGALVDAQVTNADDTITVVPTDGFVAGEDYTLLINESGTISGEAYSVDYIVMPQSSVKVKDYYILSDFDDCINLTGQSVNQTNFEAMFDILSQGNCSDYSETTVIGSTGRKHFRRVEGSTAQTGDYAFQTGVSAKLDTATTAELGEGTKLQLWPLAGAKTADKLVLEMDTKISSSGRVRFQNVFNSGNVDIFLNTGYIYGGTVEYSTGVWKKLRIEFDYADNVNKAYVYYDGVKCGEISNISTANFRTKSSQMVIRLNEATETGFDFAIDNLKLYQETTIANLSNAGYAMADDIAKVGCDTEAIVPADAKSIVLSMKEGFAASNPNAIVTVANNSADSYTTSKSGDDIFVTPTGGFTDGSTYTLFVNESASKAGPGYEIEYSALDVNKAQISETSDGYNANVVLVSDKSTTCTFIFTHYTSNNTLSSISTAKCNVAQGINKLSAQCAADGNAEYVKVMCLSELNTITPVAAAADTKTVTQ